MLMQKLISCMCHQFAPIAFFSLYGIHTMRKMSQHISIASNSLASSSHTNTNPQCMAANFIEANAFVFRLHLFLVSYTHLKDRRARGERTTNDNDFVHTFIVTYVLTFSTIIFGLCGIDTFLFPLTQQSTWIERKRMKK